MAELLMILIAFCTLAITVAGLVLVYRTLTKK